MKRHLPSFSGCDEATLNDLCEHLRERSDREMRDCMRFTREDSHHEATLAVGASDALASVAADLEAILSTRKRARLEKEGR